MTIQEEALQEQQNEERNADRERQFRKDEDNYEDTESDELTPEQLAEKEEFLRDSIRENGIADEFDKLTIMEKLDVIVEQAKDLAEKARELNKVHAISHSYLFPEDNQAQYEVEQEINADHAQDNKI